MKKSIHNIFSEEKEAPKEQPNKIPIIIDTREKQSLVYANLVEQNANAKFETLAIGDYLIGDIAIERKTFKDFQSSIINKRLIQQLEELRKYPNPILIVEGFAYNYQDSIIHENAVRGMFLSSILDFGVPILFTENEKDTARTLLILARRFEKPKREFSKRFKKTEMTPEEQKQFILEGFPGVGPVSSKALLSKFKTLKKVFNLKKEEMQKEEILDEKTAKEFEDILNK